MTAYYNEFDPKAAAWIRELIRRGLIADGVVDERSILDVEPSDLAGFTQCHFFAGIGGWSLALRLAAWADDRPVWTGSPPCQPFSAAGRQLGKADERHLAPHFAALVAACQPPVLFGEQVASAAVFGKAAKRTGKAADGDAAPEWAWLDDLCDRLEAAHYAVGASDIPAAGVGAAHIRQRTFFGAKRLAHADDARSQGRPGVPERTDQLIAGAGGLESGLEHDESGGRQQWRPEPSGRGAASGRGGVGLGDTGGPASQRDAGGVSGAEAQEHGARELVDGRVPVGPEHAGPSVGGLADPSGGSVSQPERREDQRDGHAAAMPDDRGADATDSPWGTADWLFCRDGKWRPVKSSILGVPDGVPGELVRSGAFVPASYPLSQPAKESRRVMRLRGYGNAIVPHAAAEFIKAFDAASDECFRLTDVSAMTTDNNHEGVFG